MVGQSFCGQPQAELDVIAADSRSVPPVSEVLWLTASVRVILKSVSSVIQMIARSPGSQPVLPVSEAVQPAARFRVILKSVSSVIQTGSTRPTRALHPRQLRNSFHLFVFCHPVSIPDRLRHARQSATMSQNRSPCALRMADCRSLSLGLE
jgi:hypothetical protein